MILATYFDNHTSCAQPVRLVVEAGEAALFEPEGTMLRCASLSTLRVPEHVRHTSRLITSENGAFCEINCPMEQTLLNVLLHRISYCEGWVAVTQNSWKLALGSLLTMVAVLALGHRYGLSWGTRTVVNMVS